jgi:hypothetical protein
VPDEGVPIVVIDADTLDHGRTAALRALPRETGGILVGWRIDGGIRIAAMLEVPTRRSSRSRYVRSERRANAVLRAHASGLPDGSPVGYVGDWHTHPAPQPASPIDLMSIAEFAVNDRNPIAHVVLVHNGGDWEPEAWYASTLIDTVCVTRAELTVKAS